MKQLKKDLKVLTKILKQLTKKTENMAKKLNKIEKAQATKKRKVKTAAKRKTSTVAKRKVKTAAKRKTTRKVTARRDKRTNATDKVFAIIRRSRKGVATNILRERTGVDDNTMRGIVFRLKKQGKIKSAGRGIYVKVESTVPC